MARGLCLILISLAGLFASVAHYVSVLNHIRSARHEFNSTSERCESDLLVFNRVPKVGSQTILNLIGALRRKNNFKAFTAIDSMSVSGIIRLFFSLRLKVVFLQANRHGQRDNIHSAPRAPPIDRRGHRQGEEEAQCYGVSQTSGRCYEHFETEFKCAKFATQNFLSFEEFEQPSPVYMNFVRDPVERLISWYYYVRAPWYHLVEDKSRFYMSETGIIRQLLSL